MSMELFTHEPPPLEKDGLGLGGSGRIVPPMLLTLKSRKTCLMAKFESNITGSHVFEAVNRYLETSQHAPPTHVIADLRASSLNAVTATTLFSVAEGLEFWLQSRGFNTSKVALVATSCQPWSEARKIFNKSETELQNIHIFSYMDDAIEWIESL